MKISIALCTYNGEKYLAEQLESLLAQTRLPDEMIVCDDCSTDRTVEIVRQFAVEASFPVHLYINEQNLRSTENFEKAISLCAGDIIFPADQDDVWLPEKIELFEAEFLKDATVGMAFCNGEIVDENLKSYNCTSWDLREFRGERHQRFTDGKTFEILREGNFVSGCMMAFRADFRELLLPIPTDLSGVIHDHWIALILSLVSRAVALPRQPLVKYRQHSQQQMGLKANPITPQTQISATERARQKTSFDEQLILAGAIQKRLYTCGNGKACASALDYINQYVAHMRARVALQNKETARISIIFRELTSLRYHRYSNGLKSAFKDLMF